MPSRSWTFALWTLASSTRPWVSTKRWRFLPFTFLAPPYPRCSPPTPDVLTDWLSTMPALGVPLQAYPRALTQGGVHPFPGPIHSPEAEVVVDGLPRREVVGQKAPSTAAAYHVKNRVEDLAQAMQARSPFVFWERQERFEALPLFVGEIGQVGSSHAYARVPVPTPIYPFSDGF